MLKCDTPGCKLVQHQLHTACIGIRLSGDFSSKKTEGSSVTIREKSMLQGPKGRKSRVQMAFKNDFILETDNTAELKVGDVSDVS